MRLPSSAPLRSLRSLASSSPAFLLPSASIPSSFRCLATAAASSSSAPALTPTPTTSSSSSSSSSPKPYVRYDPSMYVVSRPKALPGVPAPSGRVYSERAKAFLIPLLKVLGSNKTSKAIDGSRYILGVCSDAVERNGDFFFDECKMPQTVQSYFHNMLLPAFINITRLRALPPTHSKLYQTEFLTHFFSLLEVRMRRTMGPRHPERYIKKHMVIYGEQFRGCQLSFDLALAGDDVELAMYVWRNMFGARGMQRGAAGVKVPTGDTSKRLVSSLAVGKPDGMGGIITEEDLKPKLGGEGRIGPVPKDTKSPPLLDEIPEDWDPLMMVEQISEVVGYIRREVRRLEDIPDEMVQAGFVGAMGPIREVDVPLWREIMQEEAEKVLAEKGEDWMPSRFI